MFGKKGQLHYPFEGISKEKFYIKGHPRYYDKLEEISLFWKIEFDSRNKGALVELLREGGPSFLCVPWIKKQMHVWKKARDVETLKMLHEIEALGKEKHHGIKGDKPYKEKTVMLKDYDTYFAKYKDFHEQRKEICGDCSRYKKDPLITSCFDGCDYPDRFEKLNKLAEEKSPLKCVFKYSPHRMALRLTVIDGEVYRKRNKEDGLNL